MKVGIAGLGYRLGYLGKVFTEMHPDFRIAGYVDPAPAGLEGLQKAGISAGTRYDTVEEMLKGEKLDLLMVGSPNHMHLDHIRAGFEAGVKVFSEKPVVVSTAQSLELAGLLSRYGRENLLIGLVLRYAPLYRDLRAAQAAGHLGDIVSIEASEHIPPYHGAFFMRDWRRYDRYAGGFMLEKCCHDIDLYNGVIGARPSRVSSFGGRRTFVPANDPRNRGINDLEVYHRKPVGWNGTDKVFDSDAEIIDYQVAIVEYANGAALSFHTNLNVPDDFRRFAVIGTRGMAEGDFVRGFLNVTDSHTSDALVEKTYKATALSQHYGADEEMAAGVVASVLTGAEQPVSVLDALEAGLLAMAMDEARAKRTVIDMAPVWDRYDEALMAKVVA
ncbi:Gfo/Idh/MocA family protein [Pseudoruegeria sp. HB172150]|uniref:Gfo/Idh/MocA family protein n=1 Tax=Pseudoruegeria sp. HB172150 TaxID=2721164 RepID=UPI0015519C09|nr:Gfo/Idh/MocA family oxidoreductase [Pseudoruegeria sp. HB172150]